MSIHTGPGKIPPPLSQDDYPCSTVGSPASALGGIQGIAPFKYCNAPYGAFANTTEGKSYPIAQQISHTGKKIFIQGNARTFNWSSSEAAFHAQKIIFLLQNLQATDPRNANIPVLENMLLELEQMPKTRSTFLPRDRDSRNNDTYDKLVEKYVSQFTPPYPNKFAFDKACKADFHPTHNAGGATDNIDGKTLPYTYHFMKHTIRLKLLQHPELALAAMNFALRGIMPAEISQHDFTWATGPNGEGSNYLGIIIAEVGNEMLKVSGHPSAIPDPHAAYALLQKNHQADIGHHKQEQYTRAGHPPQAKISLPTGIDIQKLQAVLSKPTTSSPAIPAAPHHGAGAAAPTAGAAAAARTHTASHTAAQRVLNEVRGEGVTQVTVDDDARNPSNKVLKFSFTDPNKASAFSAKHGRAPLTPDGLSVICGEQRAPLVLKKYGLTEHGKAAKHPMWGALKFDAQAAANPSAPGRARAAVHQHFGSPGASAAAAASNTAAQRVLNKVLSEGVTQLAVNDDARTPGMKVLSFTFADSAKAIAFAKKHGNAPMSSDKKSVICGERRAPIVLEKYGLKDHGKTSKELWDTLKDEATAASHSSRPARR